MSSTQQRWSKMRILILSQWYWPEPNFKTHTLARGLVERGHQVTVVTGYPNYPSGHLFDGYRQKLWQLEEKDGVRIIRVPLYPSHDRSSIRRIINYMSFAFSASILGPLLCGAADIMWVYHPPLTVGIPAWWISRLRRIPFVYEIQDMWPETVVATSMLSNRWVISGLNRIANFIYERARAIIVLSPGFKANLIDKRVSPDKIYVIPNWGEDYYEPLPKSESIGEEYELKGRFNIIFAGNIGPAQALSTVIDAAGQLRDITAIQFIFVGDGIELPNLEEQVAKADLKNVRFIERQPPHRMPEILAWADGLLIHLRNDPLFYMTIPSKTLAYLASGKPILCGVLGDAANVVQEAGAGVNFHPEDAEAMASAVRNLYEQSHQERKVMGDAGRCAFEENFTSTILINRYEELFQCLRRQSSKFP